MSSAYDHEQAFADQALADAILTQSQANLQDEASSGQTPHGHSILSETEISENEISPLLKAPSKRQPYLRAGNSFQRSLNEPWQEGDARTDLPWYKRPSAWWLMPAFIPLAIAFGGMVVPRTYLILDLICKRYASDQARLDPGYSPLPGILATDNAQCSSIEVQQQVTYFGNYINLLSGGLSAVTAPYLGSLSDRMGRKYVLVCCTLGLFVTEVVTILIGKYPETVSLYWMLPAYALDGLCGSITVILAITLAYVADSTPPAKRAAFFGYFYASLFGGMALGPLVTGMMIKLTGSMLTPFYMAVICHLFFFFIVLVVVPESLHPDRKAKARKQHAARMTELSAQSWIGTMKKFNPFQTLWVLRPEGAGSSLGLRRNLIILASMDFLMFGVLMGVLNIILIYPQYVFGWDAVETSFFFSVCSTVRVGGLLLVLPLLGRLLRGPSRGQHNSHHGADKADLRIIRGALVLDLLGYLGYAFAPTGGFLYAAGMTAAVGSIGSPSIIAALTKHMPPSMTGQLLGAVALLHALARVIAPTIFSVIYAQTLAIFPGMVFLCLSTMWIAAFIISWVLKPGVYLDEHATQDQDTQPEITIEEVQ